MTEGMAELAGLDDLKVRAVNEKHGDDHGVKKRPHAEELRVLRRQSQNAPA